MIALRSATLAICSATCVNCSAPVTSPTAHAEPDDVRSRESTTTAPLSVRMPAASRFSPSVIGRRPVATKSRSAVTGPPLLVSTTGLGCLGANGGRRRADANVDPLGFEQAVHEGGRVGILPDQDRRSHFEDRDARAQPREHLCELEPDRTSAQDHDRPGQFILIEYGLVGPVVRVLETRDGRDGGNRARRDHKAFRPDPADTLHLQGRGVQEAGGSEMHGHPHAAEPLGVVVMRDRRTRGSHSLHDRAEFASCAPGSEPQPGGVIDVPRQARRRDERLRGHAPGPQAVASESGLLDQRLV